MRFQQRGGWAGWTSSLHWVSSGDKHWIIVSVCGASFIQFSHSSPLPKVLYFSTFSTCCYHSSSYSFPSSLALYTFMCSTNFLLPELYSTKEIAVIDIIRPASESVGVYMTASGSEKEGRREGGRKRWKGLLDQSYLTCSNSNLLYADHAQVQLLKFTDWIDTINLDL